MHNHLLDHSFPETRYPSSLHPSISTCNDRVVKNRATVAPSPLPTCTYTYIFSPPQKHQPSPSILRRDEVIQQGGPHIHIINMAMPLPLLSFQLPHMKIKSNAQQAKQSTDLFLPKKKKMRHLKEESDSNGEQTAQAHGVAGSDLVCC